MSRKPQKLDTPDQSLEVRENPITLEEMSEELRSLNLKPNELGDFMKAVEVCVLLREGRTWDEVSIAVGVPKRTLQWDRWQTLIRKAMTFIISRETSKVRAAEAGVLARWTNIINAQANIAESGKLDRDRVEAAKFLYEAVISKVQDAPDASSQKKYLEMVNLDPTKQNNQHNPMNVLHVVHHHKAEDGSFPQESDDYIDIDATGSTD